MQCGIYQPRTYQRFCQSAGLKAYHVGIDESDLFILADNDIRAKALRKLSMIRQELTQYLEVHRQFANSLTPVQVAENAPGIVPCMARAGARVGVGPMAAVAGAISEEVARDLYVPGHDIIIENGGDIFAFCRHPLMVALYAGTSPLSMKIGLRVENCVDGIGVCTSSGSVGHSLSFGNADAVTVVAKNGALADATATALGNIVQNASDIDRVLDCGNTIEGILGIAIIFGNYIGIQGKQMELSSL